MSTVLGAFLTFLLVRLGVESDDLMMREKFSLSIHIWRKGEFVKV